MWPVCQRHNVPFEDAPYLSSRALADLGFFFSPSGWEVVRSRPNVRDNLPSVVSFCVTPAPLQVSPFTSPTPTPVGPAGPVSTLFPPRGSPCRRDPHPIIMLSPPLPLATERAPPFHARLLPIIRIVKSHLFNVGYRELSSRLEEHLSGFAVPLSVWAVLSVEESDAAHSLSSS